MHLEINERLQAHRTIMLFADLQKATHKCKKSCGIVLFNTGCLTISAACSVGVAVFWPLPWLPYITLFFLLAIMYQVLIWQHKNPKTPTTTLDWFQWLHELDNLDVCNDERELFLELVTTFQPGSPQTEDLARTAYQSSCLSKSSFVRELYDWTR